MKITLTEGERNRFLAKVKKTSTCWLWLGGLTSDGYGGAWIGGNTITAHHVLLENPPDTSKDECANHLCGNRACVNPDHIYIGTRGDNNKDRVTANGNTSFPSAPKRKQDFELRVK